MDADRDFGVVKEPRGFIKIIQVFMAIFAFATTSGFSSNMKFNTHCSAKPDPHKFSFSYPFNLASGANIVLPLCNRTTAGKPFIPYGDYTHQSQFYVFVGVITFLYCLAAMILYIFFNAPYRQDERLPKADLIISAVLVFLWFVASVAWADGVSKLKEYTGSQRIFFEIDRVGNRDCRMGLTPICVAVEEANYASLNVSLIFGFANMVLWACSLWFLWKETSWFAGNREPPLPNEMGPEGSQM